MACALRVASENAKMGLPETSLGILPGYGGTQRLARLVGASRAMELVLTSEKGVTAAEAHRIGLVNRVVPPGQALAGARELAGEDRRERPGGLPLRDGGDPKGPRDAGLRGPGLRGHALRALRRDRGHEGRHERVPREAARPLHGPLNAVGIDLVNACVFCAGFLLSGGLTPRDGLSTEIGLSYATLSRKIEPQTDALRYDVSDVTPKFLLIGLGNAHPAVDGLGAGTPAFEWRVRIAFAPSHDEQIRPGTPSLPQVETDGTGRYENFSIIGRFPMGARDSLEVGLNRRTQKATDVLNIGGQEQEVSEQRNLTAERADGALGWRHRWRCLEVAANLRYVKVTGYNATAGAFINDSGGIFGGGIEGRYRSGAWTALLDAEWMSGSIDVHEESFPAFAPRDSSQDATLEALRVGVGYSWPRTDLVLHRRPSVASGCRSCRWPCSAPKRSPSTAGYHPDSNNKEFFGDLTVRYAFTPAIRARVGLRLGGGTETVTLTDALGGRPPQVEDVKRGRALRRGDFQLAAAIRS